jgi:hypothetical protein
MKFSHKYLFGFASIIRALVKLLYVIIIFLDL